MPYQQQFIIDGRLFPAVERQPSFCAGQEILPVSYAFFCPCCADVWARCPVTDSAGTVALFQPVTNHCRKHRPLDQRKHWLIPGSVWLEVYADDTEYLAAMPQELLQQELLLHADYLFPQL